MRRGLQGNNFCESRSLSGANPETTKVENIFLILVSHEQRKNMSRFEEHCEDCRKKLGQPFEEVHRWLDAEAVYCGGALSHRDRRHHLDGVEIVRKRWGDEAAKAAILHILLDWRYLFLENELPKNQAEAIIIRNKACQTWRDNLHKIYSKIEEKSG